MARPLIFSSLLPALLLLPLTTSGCGSFQEGSYCYDIDGTGGLVQTGELVYPDGAPATDPSPQSALNLIGPEIILCGGTMLGPITLREGGSYRGHPVEGTEIRLEATDDVDAQGRYALGINAGAAEASIYDLTLRSEGGGEGGGIGALLTNGDGVILSNVSIEGPFDEGIHLEAVKGTLEAVSIDLEGAGYGMGILLGSEVTLLDTEISQAGPVAMVVTESQVDGQGLSIVDVNLGGDETEGAAIYLRGGEGSPASLELEDVTIEGVEGYGIYSDGAEVDIKGGAIKDATQTCILGVQASALSLSDLEISQCDGYGISAQGGTGLDALRLDIHDVTSSDGSLSLGILAQQGEEEVQGVVISVEASSFEDISGPGIYIEGAEATLKGNRFEGLQGYGLTVINGSGAVEDNEISDISPFPDWTSAFGIYIPAPDAASAPSLAFSGNIIEGVETGLRIEGYNATFAGDSIKGGDVGMQLIDLPSLDASNITIEGMLDYGIFASGTGGAVRASTFAGNGVGIYCQGGILSSEGNTFTGNGVDVQGCE